MCDSVRWSVVWLVLELTSQLIFGHLLHKSSKDICCQLLPIKPNHSVRRVARDQDSLDTSQSFLTSTKSKKNRDKDNSTDFEQWIHRLTTPPIHSNVDSNTYSDSYNTNEANFDQSNYFPSLQESKKIAPNNAKSNPAFFSAFRNNLNAFQSNQQHNKRVFQPYWTLNPSTFIRVPNRSYRPLTDLTYSRLFAHSNRKPFQIEKPTNRDTYQTSGSYSYPITEPTDDWPYAENHMEPPIFPHVPSPTSPSFLSHMFGGDSYGSPLHDLHSLSNLLPNPFVPPNPWTVPAVPVKVPTAPIPSISYSATVQQVAPKQQVTKKTYHDSHYEHPPSYHEYSSPHHHHPPHHDHHAPNHGHHHHLSSFHHIPWPIMLAIALPLLLAALLLPLSLLFLGNFYFLTHFVRQSLLPLLGGNNNGPSDDENERKVKRLKRHIQTKIWLKWLQANAKRRALHRKTINSKSMSIRKKYDFRSPMSFADIQPNLRSQTAQTLSILINSIKKFDSL